MLAAAVPQGSAAAPGVRVFPSGGTVPETLLRISIVFPHAPGEAIAERVRLRRTDGSFVPNPFVDPPLWSADRRTVTLLLDPSRQKIGLIDHRAYGFVLQAGARTRLLLGNEVVKSWLVARGGCPPLDPARWRIAAVRAGTRDALVVRFNAPIDALATEYLAVALPDGARARGSAQLAPGERAWTFAPSGAWRRGARLAIHPRLEDPCGDEIGEPFEHGPGRGLGSARTTTFVPVPIRTAD